MSQDPVRRCALGALLALFSSPLHAQPGGPFEVDRIEHGAGPLFPFRMALVDAFGNPTTTIVEIRSLATLAQNVTASNPVLPTAPLPATAVLPNGATGNQYLHVRFTRRPSPGSLLTTNPAAVVTSFLTGAVSLVAVDPATGVTTALPGRAFLGGFAVFDDPNTPAFDPHLIRAVGRDDRRVVILDPRAQGFPRGFQGDLELVDPASLVFVADADDNLSTPETFPPAQLLRVEATTAVRAGPVPLRTPVCTTTSVGSLPIGPTVVAVTPADGATGVDPQAPVTLEFDQPVQPYDVGELGSGNLLPRPGGVALAFADRHFGTQVNVLYSVEPASHGDLCRYRLTAVQPFPGTSAVMVAVNPQAIRSLAGLPLRGLFSVSYTTGVGPGLVNAPVAPEAVYIGTAGASPGIAVVDLNGFGQGTGDPRLSGFVRNPNLGAPGVVPPLQPGTSLLDGGSAGLLTRTLDDLGDARLLREPLTSGITDMQLGQPLDLVFNNTNVNRNASRANQVNPATGAPSLGNTIAAAPHPNPPRLVLPPPNPLRSILVEEPSVTTSVLVPGRVTTSAPPCLPSPVNLLVTSNRFTGVFVGPQPPPPSPPPPPPFCPFTSRQQIGQFLYALDPGQGGVLVLNSNRFTVLDRLAVRDPVDLAMAPNLKLLAVSSRAAGEVVLIDTDPLSPSFHRIVQVFRVAERPTELAWQPEGEDLFVCHAGPAVSILDVRNSVVRKVLRSGLRRPRGVAVSARQEGFGTGSNTYTAYILDAGGSVAVYESGPAGVGPDALVGTVSGTFRNAEAIQPDFSGLAPGCWVVHQDAQGLGQASRIQGRAVVTRIGGLNATVPVRDLFSGNAPVDLAFDDIDNHGAYPDRASGFAAGFVAAQHSGKGQVKLDALGQPVPAHAPRLLFVALADVGKVDVFDPATGRKLRVIDAPGVHCLAHYWRQ